MLAAGKSDHLPNYSAMPAASTQCASNDHDHSVGDPEHAEICMPTSRNRLTLKQKAEISVGVSEGE